MNADSSSSASIRVYRRLLVILSLAGATFLGCGPNEISPPLWKLTGPTMGTRYAVSVIGGDEAAANTLQGQIDERLAEVNRRMSTYDPDSELSRFNVSDSVDWFEVSAETANVVAAALQLAEDSGGRYDPTVGPLVNLWGFGPDDREASVPTDEAIEQALATVGHGSVTVRVDPPALRKSVAAAYVDLSSIAKGHGVDVVAELLDEAGITSYMVEIGGEVRARGLKPGDRPWRVGVERADEPLRIATGKPRLQEVVELVDRSMATSGDYRNHFEVDGVRYSHTIDPTTGRPVTHDLATVTVLADTCREADGLATTLLVLGSNQGYDWAVKRRVAALFVSRDADTELTETATPAWKATNAEPEP